MAHKTGYRKTKWTPETIDRLRQLTATVATIAQIARTLECTPLAVSSARKMFGIPGPGRGRRNGQDAHARAYAERYGVSLLSVKGWGVDRLNVMSEEARAYGLREYERLTLRMRNPRPKPQRIATVRVTSPAKLSRKFLEEQRVARMMQLAESLGRKRKAA